MMFGNLKYILYIASVSGAVLAALVFFMIWRRRILKRIAGAAPANLLRLSVPRRRLGSCCLICSVLLFALVLLRPQWGERTRKVSNEGSDVLVALDVSRSMLAADVGASRLERSKNAVRWLADSLKGDRIGLIVFAGDAFLLCPLTADVEAFMVFLDSANTDSVSVQGTDIGAVLNEALRVFQKKRLTEKILLLISDGEDHEDNISGALDKLKQAGVRVYCAGIGKDNGDFIPSTGFGGENYMRDEKGSLVRTAQSSEILEKLALETDGSYFDISNNFSGLQKVMSVISSAHKNSFGSRMINEPVERFAVFTLPLIVLLTLELLLSEGSISRTAASNPFVKSVNVFKRVFRRRGKNSE